MTVQNTTRLVYVHFTYQKIQRNFMTQNKIEGHETLINMMVMKGL